LLLTIYGQQTLKFELFAVKSRLEELENEREQLFEQLNAKQKEYRELLEQEAMTGERPAGKDKVGAEVEKLKKDYAEIDNKIEVVQNAKNRELKDYLPKVKEYAAQVKEDAREEFEAQAREVMAAKAKYLEAILKCHEINKKVAMAHETANKAQKQATGKEGSPYVSKFTLPVNVKYNVGQYEPYNIRDDEVKTALNSGKVEKWVRQYLEDGTLPEGDSELAIR